MTGRRVQQIGSGHSDRGPDRGLLQAQTYLVRTEHVIDDDAPDPRPNRATRRAAARAARRKK
ncbi:hypothetical protein [Streptomyces sp. 1222.5]|uniref:hypothetical protein n=1 Tax=Streptomyces sp. 1222.5 TaxID=1881026 RepID=UPI003EB8E899